MPGGRVAAAPVTSPSDPRREAASGGSPSPISGWVSYGPGAPFAPAGDVSPLTEAQGQSDAGGARRDDPSDGDPRTGGSTDPPPLRLSLVPSRSTLSSGEGLWIKVVLAGGQEITSVPFHVRFDPGVLEYLGARTGPALMTGRLQPILLASVSPQRPGDLAVGLSLAGSSEAYSGSGTLALLEFRALAPGQAELVFESASVRGTTGEPLAARIEGCSIRVR